MSLVPIVCMFGLEMSWISWKYQKMIRIADYMGYERKYVYAHIEKYCRACICGIGYPCTVQMMRPTPYGRRPTTDDSALQVRATHSRAPREADKKNPYPYCSVLTLFFLRLSSVLRFHTFASGEVIKTAERAQIQDVHALARAKKTNSLCGLCLRSRCRLRAGFESNIGSGWWRLSASRKRVMC